MAELLAESDDPVAPATREQARLLASLLAGRNRRHEPGAGGMSIASIMAEYFDNLEHTADRRRWPVIRSGPRPPIPSALRLSVYARDDFTCTYRDYGYHSQDLQLDHCVPWSAGGPDDSDNLRTICSHCNEERSNYIDLAHETSYRPTTWWCLDCWTPEKPRGRRKWKDGTRPVLVPLISSEDGPGEQVYCAHCQHYSFSPLYFVGELGRDLLATIAPQEDPWTT